MTALELFRSGKDTLEISEILKITEAEALEQLSRERSASLGEPSCFGHGVVNLSVRARWSRHVGVARFVRPHGIEPDFMFAVG